MMFDNNTLYENRSTSTTTTQTPHIYAYKDFNKKKLNGFGYSPIFINSNNNTYNNTRRDYLNQEIDDDGDDNNDQQQLQQHQQQHIDVTDNKTDILRTSNHRIMTENLNIEQERLNTFDNWPIVFMDKFILAKIGMFYFNETDKVQCYFCDVIIGRWEENDNPITEHIRWSPNCPLLKRRSTNNQPIDMDSLDRLLPPISYDVCGATDTIEIRPGAYAEGTISTSLSTPSPFYHNTPISSPNLINDFNSTSSSRLRQNNNINGGGSGSSSSSSSSNHSNSGLQFVYPDHPEYAIESARLRSYSDCWPITMKQKPEQLSEAGFFYTGIGDRVKCFSCGGGLKDWDTNDDPWEQHALWLGNCRYLKLIKGSSFIDHVKEKFTQKNNDNSGNNINSSGNNTSCNNSSSNNSSDNECKELASASAAASLSPQSKDLKLNSMLATAAAASSTATNNDELKNNQNINSANCLLINNDDGNNVNNVVVECNENNNNNINCCSKNKLLCSSNNDELQLNQQQQFKKQISEEKLCKICYAGEYNTAFLPCGHVVACAKCASSVTKCPMCRKPFTDVMRVYFS